MTQEWGPHTWKMFHTLAHKVKPEYFDEVKTELINYVFKISSNLPCPYCSSHARLYIKKIKVSSIKSKDDFINFIFLFHNNVNSKLKKPMFSFDDLHKTYENENTLQIINAFINRYSLSSRRTHLFYNALSCKQILGMFMNWIQLNIHAFER
jgi:hypothetical protein